MLLRSWKEGGTDYEVHRELPVGHVVRADHSAWLPGDIRGEGQLSLHLLGEDSAVGASDELSPVRLGEAGPAGGVAVVAVLEKTLATAVDGGPRCHHSDITVQRQREITHDRARGLTGPDDQHPACRIGQSLGGETPEVAGAQDAVTVGGHDTSGRTRARDHESAAVHRSPTAGAVDIQSPTAVDEFGALHLSGDSPEAHPVCSPFQVVGPFPMARLGPSAVDPARVCAPVEPGQCATAASPLGSGREPVGVRRLHGRPFRTAAAGHQVQHSALGRRRVGGSPSADGEVWTDTRAATSSARATAAAMSSPTVTGARVWPCSTRGRHITHRTPVEVRDLLPAPL